jgi:hypothetical protein
MSGEFNSRSLAPRILLAIAALMSFRTFEYFPGMQYIQEAWVGLSLAAIVFVYPTWKIASGLRFTSFEIYVLFLTLLDLLLPAWAAAREFGQPLLYGLLTQRHVLLIATPLLLFLAIRSRLLTPRDIEVVLLWLAWGTWLLYTLMRLLLNPENFESTGVGFVSGVNGKPSFVLSSYFITFGLLYYALLGIRRRRSKYYIAAAVLLVGVIGSADARSFLVCVAGILLYFVYRWRSVGQFIAGVGKACAVAVVVLGLVYVVNPVFLSERVGLFSDAFRVVLTGTAGEDYAANARLFEVATALPYIQKHPLLGNGEISHQWQGGAQDVLGSYFYAGDVGIIGALFSVGAIGLLIFAYQYRFALWAARRLPEAGRNQLSDGVFGFLLYSALISLPQALCVFDPEVTLFFIAIAVGLACEGIRVRRSVMQSATAIAPSTIRPEQSGSGGHDE